LHARPEVEVEVAEPVLDWRSLRTGPFGSIFRSPRLKARLQPLFSTVFTRRHGELMLPSGTVVETALDQGEIRSGERAIPFCELELELKSGAAWRLFEFAAELARAFPLHGENRSKAERGLTWLAAVYLFRIVVTANVELGAQRGRVSSGHRLHRRRLRSFPSGNPWIPAPS